MSHRGLEPIARRVELPLDLGRGRSEHERAAVREGVAERVERVAGPADDRAEWISWLVRAYARPRVAAPLLAA
jgi:hypothetical protein